MMQEVQITTRDGDARAFVHTPDGEGPWPAALMYMDAPGIRPSMHEIARRLADQGYYVLLPDLFYRSGSYEPIDAAKVFTDPQLKKAHWARYMDLIPPDAVMSDTEAFIAFMDRDARAGPAPYGVFGYCMGGRLALLAAGTYPASFAAAASYHGGGLANDAPSSPHLLAGRMGARVYVAGAIEDEHFDDAQKTRLERALTEGGVDHVVETFPAKHGWVPRDMPAHDPAEAEHHWRTLVPLFDEVLK
jgi:carboxymethylenebutenolidase